MALGVTRITGLLQFRVTISPLPKEDGGVKAVAHKDSSPCFPGIPSPPVCIPLSKGDQALCKSPDITTTQGCLFSSTSCRDGA